MIFLPLNFLAALYGMNFQYMLAESKRRFGYLALWTVTITVDTALLVVMRWRR